MDLVSAFGRLEAMERNMDARLAAFANRLSGALMQGDYAELFLIERAFARNWNRRETVRDVLRCAREACE